MSEEIREIKNWKELMNFAKDDSDKLEDNKPLLLIATIGKPNKKGIISPEICYFAKLNNLDMTPIKEKLNELCQNLMKEGGIN